MKDVFHPLFNVVVLGLTEKVVKPKFKQYEKIHHPGLYRGTDNFSIRSNKLIRRPGFYRGISE
jgi:hypothetical protein